MEKQTLKQFEKQWNILLLPQAERNTTTSHRVSSSNNHTGTTADGDPFDCSSVAIPPTHVLADQIADDFVVRWRELDQRKISADNNDHAMPTTKTDDDDDDARSNDDAHSSKKRTKTTAASLPRWYEKHVRLPEQFDYASHRPPEDDGTGDRVVSLLDPTNTTLSYHTELWKLFAEIPVYGTVDKDATTGYDMPHMEQLQNEILSAKNYDGHALSRFRMSDRHDCLPPPTTTNRRTSHTATIRFECLRQQLRRSSTPDSNRMVLEFVGSQTLLDFHQALVELTDDELWSTTLTETTSNDNSTSQATTNTATRGGSAGTAITERQAPSSGYFFIEGVFYVTGSVNYATTIQEWLQSGNATEKQRRLAHLGISSNDDATQTMQSMADTRLDQVACRLGVRYVHVHNGDVECSIFATDRRLINANNIHQYPIIIHDVWTPSYATPECEACQSRPASIATSTDCQLTGGHRGLCEACCRLFKLPEKVRDKIQRYSIWRGQPDLSAGAAVGETAF